MPDLDDYKKDKEEFEQSLDEIFNSDKTDDELDKVLDDKLGKRSDDAGESTRDQDDTTNNLESQDQGLDNSDGSSNPDSGQGVDSDTTDEGKLVDACAKCTELKLKLKEAEEERDKAEQKMKSWNGRIRAANDRVKELEEEVSSLRSDNSSSKEGDLTDQEKIDRFRNDFPEFGEVLDVMDKRYQKSKAKDKPTYDPNEPIEDDVTPAKQEPAPSSSGPSPHYLAIVKVHKDIEEVVASGVLNTWINKQSDYIRPHLLKVLDKGTSQEVIDLVSEFKNKTGWKSQLDKDPKERKLSSLITPDGSEGGGPVDNSKVKDQNDYSAAAKEAFA